MLLYIFLCYYAQLFPVILVTKNYTKSFILKCIGINIKKRIMNS